MAAEQQTVGYGWSALYYCDPSGQKARQICFSVGSMAQSHITLSLLFIFLTLISLLEQSGGWVLMNVRAQQFHHSLISVGLSVSLSSYCLSENVMILHCDRLNSSLQICLESKLLYWSCLAPAHTVCKQKDFPLLIKKKFSGFIGSVTKELGLCSFLTFLCVVLVLL